MAIYNMVGGGATDKATINVYNAAILGGQTTVHFTDINGKAFNALTDSSSYTSVSLPLGSYTITSDSNPEGSISINLTTKGETKIARFPLYIIYNGTVNTSVCGMACSNSAHTPYKNGNWFRKPATNSYMYTTIPINFSNYNRLYYSYAGKSTSGNNPIAVGFCTYLTNSQDAYSCRSQIANSESSNSVTFDISSYNSSYYLLGSTLSGTESLVYIAYGTIKLFNV